MPVFNLNTKAFVTQSENNVLLSDDSGQLWVLDLKIAWHDGKCHYVLTQVELPNAETPAS